MKLPKLEDNKGVLTSVLCLLLLVSYHASRDALITVLPTISACVNNTEPPGQPGATYFRRPMVVATDRNLGLRSDISSYLSRTRRLLDAQLQSSRLERNVPETPTDIVTGVGTFDAQNYGELGHESTDDLLKRINSNGAYVENSSDAGVEYIRTSLLKEGYDIGPRLIRELLNIHLELNKSKASSLRSEDSSSVLTTTQNASEANDASILNKEGLTEDSSIDGTVRSDAVAPEAKTDDTRNIDLKNGVDGSVSSGETPKNGASVNKSTFVTPTVPQTDLLTEEQVLKLIQLLNDIELSESFRNNPLVSGEDAIEEEEHECVSYDFRGLTFWSNWQLAVQGSVLAGVHLTSIIGLFVGHYCIEGSQVQDSTVGAVFTLQLALLLFATQAVTSLGAVALVAIRAWQGLVQGACYPVVYSLLENKKVHGRLTLGIIFSGSWLGSTLGSSLGTQDYWAVVFYVSGAVVLVVGILFIFLETTKNKPEVPCKWGEVIRKDVLVSALMHGGAVWVLHTVLLASTVVVPPEDRWWVLLSVLLSGGATAQLLDVFIEPAIPQPGRPARSHLLVTTVLSFCVTIASLLVLALEGPEEDLNLALFVVVGGVGGSCFGYGVASVGYREVLEAVEAHRRSKALVITDAAGALGASIACWLLLPMVQAGGNGGYITGCMLPFSAASGGAVCVFMFLLFPKTPEVPNSEGRPSVTVENVGEDHPDGVYVIPTPISPPTTQARPPPDGMSQRSVDNRSFRSFKSFKSFMSTASFKTAISRPRATSINTVYEDVEDDLDNVSLECKSIALEDEPNEVGLRKLEVQASYSDLLAQGDRTSAWLRVHHNLEAPRRSSAGLRDPSVAPKPLPGLLF